MRCLGLCLIPFLFSCSVFENEQDLEIHPPSLIGEWILTESATITQFEAPTIADTSNLERFITYQFYPDQTCYVKLNVQNDFWYENCRWEMYKDGNEHYLWNYFETSNQIWQGYLYVRLYKVIKLTDNRITLIKLESNFD